MRHIGLSIILIGLAACTEVAYRLPYPDGTQVFVTQDDTTHNSPNARMYDFRAPQPGTPLVAARAGWVRFIKDSGGSNAATNNYVWIEHPLDYCQPSGSAPPGDGGLTSQCRTCARGLGRCNEWSAYIHMVRDSVREDAQLTEGDWVVAGQMIGIEGDVGYTDCGRSTDPDCGRHGHFHVWSFPLATLAGTKTPDENGDYSAYIQTFHQREELVPAICTANGLRRVRQGETHVAAPCP